MKKHVLEFIAYHGNLDHLSFQRCFLPLVSAWCRPPELFSLLLCALGTGMNHDGKADLIKQLPSNPLQQLIPDHIMDNQKAEFVKQASKDRGFQRMKQSKFDQIINYSLHACFQCFDVNEKFRTLKHGGILLGCTYLVTSRESRYSCCCGCFHSKTLKTQLSNHSLV